MSSTSWLNNVKTIYHSYNTSFVLSFKTDTANTHFIVHIMRFATPKQYLFKHVQILLILYYDVHDTQTVCKNVHIYNLHGSSTVYTVHKRFIVHMCMIKRTPLHAYGWCVLVCTLLTHGAHYI